MLKLAQIVASLESRHGGPSRSVLGLSTGLASGGCSVELLTTEPKGSATTGPVANLQVRRFPRQWPHLLAASGPLRDHLLATDYDLIHAHALWQRPLHYAHQAARRKQRPLVISPRGMMSSWAWRHHRWKKFIARQFVHPGAFAAAAGWHATSADEAADIQRLGFRQPICVAPNGVNIPTSAAMNTARAYWHKRCPALAEHRVALFYSRFHPKKRVLELMELWAAEAPRDWLLLVVGIPEAYSVGQLRDTVERLHAKGRIEVFDGTDSPSPYAAADVYLLPTHSENFGLTVAEALAHGVPVLTTDGTPWTGLEAKEAGHCIPWADYGRVLCDLLREEPVRLRARGRNGLEWMRAEFSWEKSAAVLGDFYREILAKRP